ncbi:hypothetical protein [Variibacter gotjawalensis]|uniref:hypothetical protein n=1 Tax=Variibacter gotjawalensis TaxID=1333996 RepID=UPI000BBA7964|nr:hypothetical protein [Variibacter gotjawalensis]NIK47876.1 hypothetical protein [Variibacter gotjawalensis]
MHIAAAFLLLILISFEVVSAGNAQTSQEQICMAAAVREIPQGVAIADVRMSSSTLKPSADAQDGIVEIEVKSGSLHTTLQFGCVLEKAQLPKIRELEAQ